MTDEELQAIRESDAELFLRRDVLRLLNEIEALRDLIQAIKMVRSTERKRFVRHLERAAEIVSSWPEWKRLVLGGSGRRPKEEAP